MTDALYNVAAAAAKLAYEKPKIISKSFGGTTMKSSLSRTQYFDKYQGTNTSIPYWKRLDKLSTENHTVFESDDGKQAIVAYAGTNKLSDLPVDFKIMSGIGLYNDQRFKDAVDIGKLLVGKYGADNVTAVGHSLGGRQSLHVGKELGIRSVSFNTGMWLPDLAMNIRNDLKKNPDAFKKATIYVNPLDVISNVSALVPGATVKYGGEKNQYTDLLKDVASTAIGAQGFKPFSHLETRPGGFINSAATIGKYLEKMVGYHAMDQYGKKMSTSTGGSTLKESLGRTVYKPVKAEDWIIPKTNSSAPLAVVEPHDSTQEYLQNAQNNTVIKETPKDPSIVHRFAGGDVGQSLMIPEQAKTQLSYVPSPHII